MSNQIDLEAANVNKEIQSSEELIHILNSCDVTVSTTDTKAAISLQASLQAVIALIVNIAIADSTKADTITQELLQTSKIKQQTVQKIVIDGSQNVDVTTTDTQIAANIQVLLQLLIALLVEIDVL
ncbi:spore coat protein [Alkalihalobacterium chitinilyticum]|uniref:Spore coat protein n=1 Tax=Alkalihalobacterium chitinilyticum TaxID=2980103 RepID=A0ABT5VDD9_9BACI|nr:spore coat protein [Alkalihalobacterium chitinilyticum]MDE5413454.1 spore coat protein [Alkalihalobacterium chitinilyticum]